MQTGLKRELNLLDLTMVGLGSVIGSGWLFATQKAGNMAGPAAIFSWIIGGIAITIIALAFAELGAMLPEAGGVVRYPQYSHGNLVGYITGFAFIVAYSTVPAIEAEAVVQYMSSYIKILYNGQSLTFAGWLVTIAFIVAFFLLNYYSVKVFARVNTVVTFIKFLVPFLTIVILFTQFRPGNLVSHGFLPFGWSGVFSAVSSGGIVFAYFGFRQPVDMSGEAKNPQRNVPLAVLLSIGIGTVLFTLLQVVFIGALPVAQLAQGWGHLSFRSPFADLALLLGFTWLAVMLFGDALLSPAGAGNIYIASTTRVIYAQSNNGFWWKIFKYVDQKSGIPRPAMWLALILAVIWTVPFPAWSKMVGIISGALVFTCVIGVTSAISLRRTAPDLHRPLQIKGLPAVALIAFVVGSLLIYWTGWVTNRTVMSVELLGLLIYAGLIWAREDLRKDAWKNIKAGIWLVAYMLFSLTVSYLGGKEFGGHNIIKYPADMLIIIVGAIIAFYWGKASAFRTEDVEKAIVDQQEIKGT